MVRSAAVLFKKLLKTYLSIFSDFNEETCIQETDNQYYGVFIWLTSVVKKNLREQNLYKPLFDETMKIVVKIVCSGNNGFF